MSNTPLLDDHLRTLKLPAVRANYRRLADKHPKPVDYLGELIGLEIEKRHENVVKARIGGAHFPAMKTFDTFDFSAQPTVPKVKLLEFADAGFVEQRRNLVFYGPPGTGKTHCLIAIGVAACMHGHRTLFTTAAGLLSSLLDAKRDGGLTRKLRSLERYHLLLIDELGYIPFEREATDLLFQVISRRYETASIALTTNLAFEQWTQVFPDAMAASAVIDRLIHHGTVFEFSGGSHRLRSRAGKAVAAAKP
ncbi:MAG: IS21-like element helper ATPase IstB [Candidatus Tyrphobacter sp.]